MTETAEHISQIIGLLNDQADYAVLRNFEGLPDKNTSRDIDIIITRESLKRVKPSLVKMIDESGWKIITYLNSDRLVTFVCAKNKTGSTEMVQWDFFINTSVFGILLMDATEFLAYKKFNGFLYYVGVDGQFLDKYLYNRAVGSPYPEKYYQTREEAEHLPMVQEKLRTVFGVKSVEEADKVKGRKLLLRAIAFNLRSRPLKLLMDVMRFLYTFIRNYVCSDTAFSIGFTGPDGAGKTTVINLMIDRLGAVFKKAHVYLHFRPTLFGNLGDVAQSAGVKKNVDRNYDQPHRGGRTSVVSSLLRLSYYSVDYVVGYFLKVKPHTRITRLVIFDRYFTDIICDSRRSRIYLPARFLYWYGKLIIPSLDYNVLLSASTETILRRKAELDKDEVVCINEKINYLAGKKGYLLVMNEHTPDEAVDTIFQHVFSEQHRKNLKRLGFS